MNNKVKIRTARESDVEAILEIYSPFILKTAVSFEIKVPTKKDMWERISGILKDLPFLVCESEGKITGYAYASNHRQREAYRWSKEVSAYVHPDFRGKHIASGLYTSLIEILKKQGITNLLAGIALPNPGSIALHKKFGFRKIAEYTAVGFKLGKWHNVGWWELNLDPGFSEPKEIIPFSEIKKTDVLKDAFLKGEETIIL